MKSGQWLYQCVVGLSSLILLTPFIPQIYCHTISNFQSGDGQRPSVSLLPEAQAVLSCHKGQLSLKEDLCLRSLATHLRHSPPNPTTLHPQVFLLLRCTSPTSKVNNGLTLHPNARQGDLGRNKITWEWVIERLVKNVIPIIHALKKTHSTSSFYRFKCFIYAKGDVCVCVCTIIINAYLGTHF